MDRHISIIGNPVTIAENYIALIKDNDTNDTLNITKNNNGNIKMIEYECEAIGVVQISIHTILADVQVIFMDCYDTDAEDLQNHVESLMEMVETDDVPVIVIHPIVQSKLYVGSKIFRCMPFDRMMSIIEHSDVYSMCNHMHEVLRDDTNWYIGDATHISSFVNAHPDIITCCMEEEIIYPDFVHVKSSDAISNKMDAVSIDKTFKRNGSWKNVSIVKYVNNSRSSANNHVCKFNYDGIDTLIIAGENDCDDDCDINVPNVIFIDVEYDKISDFCKNNATIVRFNHECLAKNSYDLLVKARKLIKRIRINKY